MSIGPLYVFDLTSSTSVGSRPLSVSSRSEDERFLFFPATAARYVTCFLLFAGLFLR